ncbi:hypothetical protein AYO21_02740 [Fonsecaea monophora]|uniref:Phenylacetyl-CoA ligase n=1 Tax=Fonsecaea monophora TaxID=254056 RepID=A0A177FHB6_9EURO|nr:hypothetical protein AYO21_02740 [Fonsecaea monophora]OAG43121.1 hypothetical protein AYO21_02740 [Fonsecaea monophora]
MTIFHSPFPLLNLPETDIFSFLFERNDRPFPNEHGEFATLYKAQEKQWPLIFHTAVIFKDAENERQYSYSQVKQTALSFGRGLRDRFEWQKGDVLVLFAANNVDTPGLILGTLWTGGVISPANPGYTVRELVYQLQDCGARAVATQFYLLETVKEACRQVGISEDSILLVDEQKDPSGRIKHYTEIQSKSLATRYQKATIEPKADLAFLVYSSGTTGKPKGVRLSHYNLTSNVSQLQPGEQYNLSWDGSRTSSDIPLPRPGAGGDKILACLPFFHIYGLTTTVLNPLYTGTTTIVLARFEIEKWCRLVQHHSITFSYIVPPIVLLLCKHPAVPSYDLSSIRMTNSGAAPLSREMVETCFQRTGIRVKQGYGLSETSPTAFNQPWDDWNVSVGSVGKVLSNMEAKICTPADENDPTDRSHRELPALPQGTVGELHVRGPNVFLGYHHNPAATAECLSPTGWFRTGDVGYMDAQGNLFLTDRVKELIKYKGFQVAPAELEGYLLEHPLVADCAVVGVQSAQLGTEVPRAYIVPAGGAAGDNGSSSDLDRAKLIIAWLNSRVANHKKLRGGVKFVQQIPKTASGKILRRILKEQAKAEASSEVGARVAPIGPRL